MIKSDEVKAYAMLAAGALGLFLIWKATDGIKSIAGGIADSASSAGAAIGEAATTAVSWVNPAADTNIVYRATNAIGSAATGDSSFSLGSWIYDQTHPDVFSSATIKEADQTDAEKVAAYSAWDSYGNYAVEPPAPAWTGGATGSW